MVWCITSASNTSIAVEYYFVMETAIFCRCTSALGQWHLGWVTKRDWKPRECTHAVYKYMITLMATGAPVVQWLTQEIRNRVSPLTRYINTSQRFVWLKSMATNNENNNSKKYGKCSGRLDWISPFSSFAFVIDFNIIFVCICGGFRCVVCTEVCSLHFHTLFFVCCCICVNWELVHEPTNNNNSKNNDATRPLHFSMMSDFYHTKSKNFKYSGHKWTFLAKKIFRERLR